MKIHVLTENTAARPEIIAEHGLSLLIETGGQSILFDMGQTDAFAKNAEKMGLDPFAADFALISHGHYDHGGGLACFLERSRSAPVYLSRRAFEPHYHGREKYIGLDPALAHHPRLRFVDEAMDLSPSVQICVCQPEAPVQPVSGSELSRLSGGVLVPDDFCHEIYLLIREKGRRILFSGCSHRGILNIARRFRPDILVGGFHFKNVNPEEPATRLQLEQAGQTLLEYPTFYYTCHCTGVPQYRFLKTVMGGRLSYLSAGQSVTI